MHKDWPKMADDLNVAIKEVRLGTPEVMKAFSAMAAAATEAGTLDAKTKELIALAIGVTQHCDGCIGFHAKALIELGATRQEVAEVMAMCVYMGGGPALMYAADAMRAYDQFAGA